MYGLMFFIKECLESGSFHWLPRRRFPPWQRGFFFLFLTSKRRWSSATAGDNFNLPRVERFLRPQILRRRGEADCDCARRIWSLWRFSWWNAIVYSQPVLKG